MDKSLDAFITGTLDNSTVNRITDELQKVVAQAEPAHAKQLMSAILKTACSQDLHERGMFYIFRMVPWYTAYSSSALRIMLSPAASSHRTCCYSNHITMTE
jgi:hypothetical protein